MIFFLAWLVLIDATEEASFFCMMKGHTYSRIDQTFRALIGQLLSVPVWTVTSLVRYIGRYLGAYNCKCQELDCLWDWKSFFAPHVHERFGGFATSQFGSGMHEFVLRKNQHMVRCVSGRGSTPHPPHGCRTTAAILFSSRYQQGHHNWPKQSWTKNGIAQWSKAPCGIGISTCRSGRVRRHK